MTTPTTKPIALYPCDNYEFSGPVLFRSKAQRKGNGYSIAKHWNAAKGQHRDALWVSLSTSMDCVPPLGKLTELQLSHG